MAKKQKMIITGLVIVLLVASLVFYFAQRPSDKCTALDRQQNNCVPAGRCVPLGDPREATVDCQLKNYDHKFELSK